MKLLTFLGTRPIETTYVMPDGQEFTAPFCGVALAHLLDITEARVFVTQEAREQSLPVFQERVQAANVHVVPVDIPGDATEEDLWGTFKAVVHAVQERESVIFDITHGFRSVSFLSFLAASYLRIVKDVHLVGVFYGNFEARDRSSTPHRAPVINLSRMASLLDWMIAADRFERFGDARDLADLLRQAAPSRTEQQQTPELKAPAKRIRLAASAMERVSRSLRLIRPDEAMQAGIALTHHVEEAIPDIVQFAPPFALLATPVVESYRALALDVKAEGVTPCDVLVRERRMIQWYLERHQYVQALALTREWLISWTMLWLGEPDFKKRERREEVERRIGAALQGQRNGENAGARGDLPDLDGVPDVDALLRLYDRVGQMRNDLLHAGKRAQPIPAERAERRILEWCTKAIHLPLPEECWHMLVLNFAHPITEEQRARIEALTGHAITRVIDIPSHIDVQQPLEPQVRALADAAGLSAREWQTLPILVNPPSLNFSAVALLAELHGRMGYFPPIVRLRPVQSSVPPRFEVAEIVDLQGIRERARSRRDAV